MTASSRSVNGNHPKNITKYILGLHKYIIDHNILQRVITLQHPQNFNENKAESIDVSMTAGMLAAEKQCLQSYRLPWDAITHEIMMSKNIVKSHLSMLRNKRANEDTISAKMDRLHKQFESPSTVEDTNVLLRKLTMKARELKRDKHSYNSTLNKEREKLFIAEYKDTIGEKKAKKLFRTKMKAVNLM